MVICIEDISIRSTSYLCLTQMYVLILLIEGSFLLYRKLDISGYSKLLILSRKRFSSFIIIVNLKLFLSICIPYIFSIKVLGATVKPIDYILFFLSLILYFITLNFIIVLFRRNKYNYYVIYIISICIYIPIYISNIYIPITNIDIAYIYMLYTIIMLLYIYSYNKYIEYIYHQT